MLSSIFSFFGSVKYYIFGVCAVAFGIYIFFLKAQIVSLQADNNTLNADRMRYEYALELALKEQKEKIVYVDREIEVVKWKTKTKIETINEYVYDINKSDCANAMDFARSYF